MILHEDSAQITPPSSLAQLHVWLAQHNGQAHLTDSGFSDGPRQSYTLTARLDGGVRVTVHGHGSYPCSEAEAHEWLLNLENGTLEVRQ